MLLGPYSGPHVLRCQCVCVEYMVSAPNAVLAVMAQMILGGGASKSNSIFAVGGFAPKVV